METIQYSLKNNISIDIRLALKYSQTKKGQKDKLIKQSNNSINSKVHNDNIENENNNNDEIFDKPLLDIYGNRTCILFEISKDVFQLRYLDNTINTTVNRTEFYIQIPTLVEKLYTVIVVEKIIQDSNHSNMEIVAIHSPPNNTSTVSNIITPSVTK
jgi:hypothetical protein